MRVSRLSRRMPRNSAAHSTSSSRVKGNSLPLEVPATVCPDRPTRCNNRLMDLGEPIWHTRSTTPISMPNSREAVATHTFTCPLFSVSSAANRMAPGKAAMVGHHSIFSQALGQLVGHPAPPASWCLQRPE